MKLKKKKKLATELTEKELIVCHARIQNPTWAKARCYRVGYPFGKRESSYKLSSDFFKRDRVKKYINNFIKKMTHKVEVDVQYVLRNLMKIIEFNPQCMINPDGSPIALHDMDPEDAKIVQSMKLWMIDKQKENGEIESFPVVSEYKIPGIDKALDMLGKYLKMWSDKTDLNVVVEDRRFYIDFHDFNKKDEN
jgi:hypothetical protein